ncbi:hypothetical protein BKA62DRAFT_687314 [Auriculariales sp. MPI-PUGE-AT-0066]|nr:hypothetical protein BKA62DRAFT_687314 [Auriculariales sp. MPI-PUGE-AT-0066]
MTSSRRATMSPEVLNMSPVRVSHRPPVRAEHVPVALHRFAAPTGPWPWSGGVTSDASAMLDLEDSVDSGMRDTAAEDDAPAQFGPDQWRAYPQSLFRNWTYHAVQRSGIHTWLNRKASVETAVYTLDVLRSGRFIPQPTLRGRELDKTLLWDFLNEPRPDALSLRCFFVADLTGSILQQLGTKFDIEPFFFSSAFNGISSRYQEDASAPNSDHLTIVLPFLRTIESSEFEQSSDKKDDSDYQLVMDLQSPLPLHSGKTLLLDQVSLHLIRHPDGATLISLHPDSDFWLTTSAQDMFRRVQMAGRGVYWGRLWKNTEDSTFMLLIMLWHALYAWDEAMDALFDSILYEEKRAMDKNDVAELEVTHELHNIRSALLLYNGLLKDFEHSIEFIRDHPNPALERASGELKAAKSRELLQRECHYLLTECKRLQGTKDMCSERVANAFDLIFRTLTLRDTVASQMQAWVTQQITYLTTVFLPPTFIATIFGMNLDKITEGGKGTLTEYLAIILPLIAGTLWLMLALQRHQQEPERSFLVHLLWPFRDLRMAIKMLWQPANGPIHKRLKRALNSRNGGNRPRGWSRVHQQLPSVAAKDRVSESASALPLADVVRAVRWRSREDGNDLVV